MDHDVRCKKMKDRKAAEHECEKIEEIGGKDEMGNPFRLETEAVIKRIEGGKQRFFAVDLATNVSAEIKVVEGKTGKYLRSRADDDELDNLLKLPDCK